MKASTQIAMVNPSRPDHAEYVAAQYKDIVVHRCPFASSEGIVYVKYGEYFVRGACPDCNQMFPEIGGDDE